MNKNYNKYTVKISNDPSYYGTDCTQQDASRIVESLGNLIRTEFPGIRVEIYNEAMCNERSSSTFGGEVETRDTIDQWVENNWTAAL
jgi:hypothetical protein